MGGLAAAGFYCWMRPPGNSFYQEHLLLLLTVGLLHHLSRVTCSYPYMRDLELWVTGGVFIQQYFMYILGSHCLLKIKIESIVCI